MKKNHLLQLWREGKPGLGMWADLGSAAAIEMICELDVDWILLDGEHGISSYEDVLDMMRAMNGARATSIVRVPAGEYIPIKRVLDMGAEGIMVPQVRTAEEVARIVALCRYHPEGKRGVGPYRASKYDLNFMDYYNNANREIACIVQIENVEALKNLDAILAVKGLDGIFIGPADLAADMNHFPNITHPDVQKAIQTIFDKATKAGLPVGYYCNSGKEAKKLVDRGYKLVSICNDMSVLAKYLAKNALEARGLEASDDADLVMS